MPEENCHCKICLVLHHLIKYCFSKKPQNECQLYVVFGIHEVHVYAASIVLCAW